MRVRQAIRSALPALGLILASAGPGQGAGYILGDSHGEPIAQISRLKNLSRLSVHIRGQRALEQIAQTPRGSTVFLVLGTNDANGSIARLDKSIDDIVQAAEKKNIKLVWLGPPCVRTAVGQRARASSTACCVRGSPAPRSATSACATTELCSGVVPRARRRPPEDEGLRLHVGQDPAGGVRCGRRGCGSRQRRAEHTSAVKKTTVEKIPLPPRRPRRTQPWRPSVPDSFSMIAIDGHDAASFGPAPSRHQPIAAAFSALGLALAIASSAGAPPVVAQPEPLAAPHEARVAFIGDSTADGMWGGMSRLATRNACLKTGIELGRFAKNSTGLTRPERFNWAGGDEAHRRQPQARAVRDVARPQRPPVGGRRRQGHAAELAGLSRQVQGTRHRRARERGGQPRPACSGSACRPCATPHPTAMPAIRTSSSPRRSPNSAIHNLHYVDALEAQSGGGGGQVRLLWSRHQNGSIVQLRAPDGEHFTPAGELLVAAYFLPKMLAVPRPSAASGLREVDGGQAADEARPGGGLAGRRRGRRRAGALPGTNGAGARAAARRVRTGDAGARHSGRVASGCDVDGPASESRRRRSVERIVSSVIVSSPCQPVTPAPEPGPRPHRRGRTARALPSSRWPTR